jgi:parvulin-like peptidyl-prolyl isomerase
VGDDVLMRRATRSLTLLLCLVCATGCDKLPWSSKEKSSSGDASASLTTAQSAPMPAKPQVLPTDILATVNQVSISKADVELRLQELKALMESAGQPWTSLNADQLQTVLDELVNTELMSQDAVARGLDRSLDTQRRWEYLRRGFFAQEWLRWNRDRLTVSPEEVEQYYEQNRAGFRIPARVKLRQLVVASEDHAKRALAQLLDGTTDFANLAQQISLGPSAAQGGLLSTWVMRANEKAFLYGTEAEAAAAGVTSLDPVLEAAAFAIDQVNGLSGIVKGADNRYHLFQLAERQEEHQQDKTEVWDQIKNFLTMQKLQASIDELRKKAAVERFPDRLEGVAQ